MMTFSVALDFLTAAVWGILSSKGCGGSCIAAGFLPSGRNYLHEALGKKGRLLLSLSKWLL